MRTSSLATVSPDGLDAVEDDLWDRENAGLAKPAFDNADAHILSYNYQTGRGDDAYLMDIPPDGQLKMNVVMSPSAHDSSEKYHEYAKTNTYFVHAQYTSKSTGKTVYLQADGKFSPERPPSTDNNRTPAAQADKMLSFDVQDKENGEYASVSPQVTIDLNDVQGDLWVGGFAKFSAGVGGYRRRSQDPGPHSAGLQLAQRQLVRAEIRLKAPLCPTGGAGFCAFEPSPRAAGTNRRGPRLASSQGLMPRMWRTLEDFAQR